MSIKTDLIKYNVRDRGRKARGQDRNFDTVALAKLINGASVQERVRHGDMHGYYGHWPRQVLGMEPSEGGIVDGKVISIPPALRTIELRADPDGTIYHRAEFLDSNEGKIAAKLFSSKTGGFSSAIDAVPGTNPAVPKGFFGFDYVLEPNYSTNRGHKVMLDGVRAGRVTERELLLAVLDDVAQECAESNAAVGGLFDAMERQLQLALVTLERLDAENRYLIDRAARGLPAVPVLDDTRLGPVLANPVADYGRFKSMPLAGLQSIGDDDKKDMRQSRKYLHLRFGVTP